MAVDISPTAAQWWSLFNLFTTLAIIIGGVVFGFFIFAAVRYRYRPGKPDPPDTPKPGTFPKDRGKPKLVLALSATTLSILSLLIIGTFTAFDYLNTPPTARDALIIEVEGFQWAWRFRYPNGTETVGEVVVPAGKTVIFRVTSTDVKHKFGLPAFKVGIDAIPGRWNTLWIKPTTPGEYWILCYELCGVGHARMTAKIIVKGG
jgi:cytochrome c oxidase subunit 2